MILGEGAGAILFAREGAITVERTHAGGFFTKRAQAAEILKTILRDLGHSEIDLVISSANGTFVDQAEHAALEEILPDVLVYTGKPALGESVGAAALWQVILAVQALQQRELPPVLHADSAVSLRLPHARTEIPQARQAIVLGCGLNQQAAGLRLAIR